jgi:diguanylate cyclase (GGDEF)-like protein/PAS domain S-box-containing protein
VSPDEPQLDTAVLTAAPVATLVVDLLGQVCLWNTNAEEVFGWTADEVLGAPPPFFGDRSLDGALDGLERVLRGEIVEQEAVALTRRDATAVDCELSASVLRDGDEPVGVLMMLRDVTDQARVERRRSDAEEKWQRLALRAVDAVAFADADGRVTGSTYQLTGVLGYAEGSWAGRRGFELLHPDDADQAAAVWADVLAHPGVVHRNVLRARHARGHYEQVEFTSVDLRADRAVGSLVVACRVVSPQKQASRLVADEAGVLELIARDAPMDEVWKRIVAMVEYHTDAIAAIFLYDEAELRLRLHADGTMTDELRTIAHSVNQQTLTAAQLDTIREASTVLDLATDPRSRPWGPRVVEAGFNSAWSQPIVESRSSTVRGSVAVFVRERREPTSHEQRVAEVASHLVAVELERSGWQQELRRRARSDELTGLPNRTAIFERLDATLADARVQREPVTVMVCDIDRFKLVNDSLGHEIGDHLLARFAHRLQTVMGEHDFVGRMAADEFVVVFAPGVRLREAKLAARDLSRALEKPFPLYETRTADTGTDDDGDDASLDPWTEDGSQGIHLTVSVGVAMSTLGRENTDTLLQRADAAMFRAKAGGRDRVEVYDERLRTRAVKRLEIDRELRVALERGELQLYYQPEIDCRTGQIIGAEALLRWQHPTKGLIHPEGFITVAEESGSIVPIGHWVLDEAVRQARTWTDAHPHVEGFSISVNLSARQLINRSLVDTVAFVLTRYDWPPSNLILELTESILIEDRDATLYVLNRLRLLGVKLAIDDFGTGFASLDYLHRLHVDWIKIDRSFVRMLDAEGNGSPVATAMMHMARAFELGVIAEGVEEPRQVEGLRRLGCDVLQGFLFAKPLPPDEFGMMLAAPAE